MLSRQQGQLVAGERGRPTGHPACCASPVQTPMLSTSRAHLLLTLAGGDQRLGVDSAGRIRGCDCMTLQPLGAGAASTAATLGGPPDCEAVGCQSCNPRRRGPNARRHCNRLHGARMTAGHRAECTRMVKERLCISSAPDQCRFRHSSQVDRKEGSGT